MNSIEEMGLSFDEFSEMYDEYDGFNPHNSNHPERNNGEDYYEFLANGARNLINDNSKIIDTISIES